jgi:hypothetical protein
MDRLRALDVCHRAVNGGAVDWRVMTNGDRVVALGRALSDSRTIIQ